SSTGGSMETCGEATAANELAEGTMDTRLATSVEADAAATTSADSVIAGGCCCRDAGDFFLLGLRHREQMTRCTTLPRCSRVNGMQQNERLFSRRRSSRSAGSNVQMTLPLTTLSTSALLRRMLW